MSLTDRLNGLFHSAKRNLKNLGIATTIVASTYFNNPSKAEIINVNPSWNWQNINYLLDGNPNTQGNGRADAVAGDLVVFAPGIYQLQMQQGASFELRINSVNLTGLGWNATIFRGASPYSTIAWKIYSSDNTLSNFRTENAFAGLWVGGDNYNNINFRFIKTIGHTQHYIWREQNAPLPINIPSIKTENCYIINGATGFHFNEIQGTTRNTKYLGMRNVTIDGVSALGIDAPLVIENNRVIEVRGNNDFFDTVIVNTRASFRERAYEGFRSPIGFVEHNNGSGSLQSRGFPGNIEANPLLDAEGRPQKGSPAIGPQYFRGYAGAVPPRLISPLYGDINFEESTGNFNP